jgi:hypothetical protein
MVNAMCVGDWRLGRMIRANYGLRLVLAGQISVINANPQRVGIDFNLCYDSPNNASDLLVGPSGNWMWSSSGLQGPPEFRLTKHGHLVQESFTVFNPAAGDVNFTYIEYTLPEDVISAAVQQFQSEYSQWLLSSRR